MYCLPCLTLHCLSSSSQVWRSYQLLVPLPLAFSDQLSLVYGNLFWYTPVYQCAIGRCCSDYKVKTHRLPDNAFYWQLILMTINKLNKMLFFSNNIQINGKIMIGIRIIQFYLLILKKTSLTVVRWHTSEFKTTNSSPVVKLLPLWPS